MKLGIGIDTGGTYTDAVLYNFDDKSILGTAKALTTKQDLSVGILEAIDGLPAKLIKKAELISLSTTLATNACVEDTGGRAKLIFFGGDEKVVDELGSSYGLPPSNDMYIQESFSTFSGETTREPDWPLFCKALEEGFDGFDGVGIVEMNAMRTGAAVEKKAKALFQSKHDIPVVCGHELFSELNCLQRGASTLLNAGLFPVIREFLLAVKKALALRDIYATLVIVRSDGSLMSEAFAAVRPVETLLCGPAASAIGGTQLTNNQNSIIVDMGGTTTDIALVKEGVPVTATDGVSIGKWKTFVDGLYIKTFGLGGDSAIHYAEKRLYIEDYRITPLCIAAAKYPSIVNNLKKLQPRTHTHFLYEHYMLMKDISGHPRYTAEEKALCHALKDRPLLRADAAAAVGKDIYTLHAARLIKDGIVQLCGLTPTDIMHINGDFTTYCADASRLAAEFAARNLAVPVDEFCRLSYDEVKRKLYVNIVKALLENTDRTYMKNGVSSDILQFAEKNFEAAKSGNRDPLLSTLFQTDYALVGIGGPIHIFLADVARMLGTCAIIPEHFRVANALGAIIGSVSAVRDVRIKPNLITEGYTVFGNNENRVCETIEEATAFALSEAETGAKEEAIKRGATGKLTITTDIQKEEAVTRDGSLHLSTIVKARAVGAIEFSVESSAKKA